MDNIQGYRHSFGDGISMLSMRIRTFMVSLYGTHAASEHCDVVNVLFVLLVYNVSIIHRTMNLYIIQRGMWAFC